MCHVKVTVSPVSVLAEEVASFAPDLCSALAAHRRYLMLLYLYDYDSLLPCLIFQFLPNGGDQADG